MDGRITITENELAEEIRAALERSRPEDPAGAFTSGELAASLGRSVAQTRVYLRSLKEQGLIEIVQVSREGLDGKVRRVAGYKLKPSA